MRRFADCGFAGRLIASPILLLCLAYSRVSTAVQPTLGLPSSTAGYRILVIPAELTLDGEILADAVAAREKGEAVRAPSPAAAAHSPEAATPHPLPSSPRSRRSRAASSSS